MPKKLNKPPEGAKMPESADMVAWRKEFEEMGTEEHLLKLKSLGLSDEELEKFKEMVEGAPLDDEIMSEGPLGKDKSTKKTIKKKVKKK